METIFLALGATIIIGTGTGVLLALIYPLVRPGLFKRQPRQRANALLGWAVAPVGIGLFFTALLFIPSLWQRLGIPAGHCHNHAERLPHICLTTPLFSGTESLPWYLMASLMVLVAAFLVSQANHLQKIARFKATLRREKGEPGADYNLVNWRKPAAFTVGFWFPQIFVTNTLSQTLSPEHLRVVLAHEQAHVKHRDPLRQYLGWTLSLLHLSRTRRQILKDLTLAVEQACDEEAVAKTGDRLLVAETIVAVERLLLNTQKDLAGVAVGFSSNSALRVEALLEGREYQRSSFPDLCLFSSPLALTSLVMPGPMHYLTELVIRH